MKSLVFIYLIIHLDHLMNLTEFYLYSNIIRMFSSKYKPVVFTWSKTCHKNAYTIITENLHFFSVLKLCWTQFQIQFFLIESASLVQIEFLHVQQQLIVGELRALQGLFRSSFRKSTKCLPICCPYQTFSIFYGCETDDPWGHHIGKIKYGCHPGFRPIRVLKTRGLES